MSMQANKVEVASALAQAVARSLASWERRVVTDYELGVLFWRVCSGQQVKAHSGLFREVLRHLESFGLIGSRKEFKPGTVFKLFGSPESSPLEVACVVDPFACASHLSAMEFYGLTDRFSKILYLTTPVANEWKAQAQQRVLKDLGESYDAYKAASLPLLRFQPFERVDGMRVELMRRASRGAFKVFSSPAVRVSMVGRTFLDMVREPEQCGGMQDVIDAYREHAARYLSVIVEEIERHGKSIEKARAGYLLDVVCKLKHPVIDGWKGSAQRGGSRVLDPKSEYASFYSEDWKLSVNVPSLIAEGFSEEGRDS